MRWLQKGKRRLCRGQIGLTLIEVLIAVAILSFIGTGVVLALDTNSRATRVLDEKVTAASLTTAYHEAIKEATYDNVSDYSSVNGSITVPSEYSVDIDVDYSDDGTTWVDTYTEEKLQKITVTVTHQGKNVMSVCTFRTER